MLLIGFFLGLDASALAGAEAGWWPESLDVETAWHIGAMLFTALIAALAAILAAWLAAKATMKNALKLQDRQHRLEANSCAALLSADLHARLHNLVFLLGQHADMEQELSMMDTSTKVLDAALPRLGGLGQQGAAHLLNAYYGLALLKADATAGSRADYREKMLGVALHIGNIIYTLAERYEVDRPQPLKAAGVDLEEIGLGALKDLGL